MAGTIEQKEGRNVVEAVAELQARDYQMECWKAIDTSFQNGVWSQVGVLPTGSGKTFVFARLLTNAVPFIREWLNGFDARRQKVLIVAHREELLDQAARSLKEANPGLNVGIEQGERRASWMDDVVIASVQSLTASGGRRLRGLNPDEFRIVIVDEAHHAAAESYRTVLAYFQVVPPDGLLPGPKATEAEAQRARAACCEWWQTHQPDRLLLGVTATPSRGDAVGLEWTFRKVVYEQTLRWMIERAYLSPLVGYLVRTATSLDGVKITAGDFNQGQLAEKVNTPVRNRLAVEAWTARAAGRKTLAFTVDIQHAKDLAAAFQSAGVAAEWISGELRPDMRRQRLEDFRRGAIQVMTNCNVLTEGFDLPDVSAILMTRPTRSQLLYCVDDATEILTPQGWARGGDIGDGSVVAAFDPKTTAIQWEAITAYTSRPIAAHERMMEMKTPALDLRVTDTHRMEIGRAHV